jgi:intraflagellar transport protein 122
VNVNSFAWNSDLEDSIAFASGGMISIKTGNLPALTQKSDANIIGFEGFQLFINKNDIITVMDISQSSTLVKYVEKKEFSMAYKLACLGVPDNDLRFLGM